MTLRQDVNSSYFEKITSGSTPLPARSVVGRCHFRGIGIIPMWLGDSSGTALNTRGTIRIEDLNAAEDGGSGTALFEMPVVAQQTYPASSFFSFADDDGYILFERGMFLTDTSASGTAPLINFSVILFYGT